MDHILCSVLYIVFDGLCLLGCGDLRLRVWAFQVGPWGLQPSLNPAVGGLGLFRELAAAESSLNWTACISV